MPSHGINRSSILLGATLRKSCRRSEKSLFRAIFISDKVRNMNIRAIGFDYGGVIGGSPGSVFEKGVGDILGVNRELFKKIYFENNFLVNTGKLTWDEFWKLSYNFVYEF